MNFVGILFTMIRKIKEDTLQGLHTKQTDVNFFLINFDDYGVYVVPGLGTRYHCHHSPINKAVS